MLNWVFGNKSKKGRRKKPGIGNKPPYQKARQIADKGRNKERVLLAAHEDMEPEILYYFATDKGLEIRCEVAQNVGTPLQADLILAKDKDEEVRCDLALKISRLIPELDYGENKRLAEMALEVLEILANDELPRVRAIIAEELKSATNVPKEIILQLAEDLEEIVSVPILEYSPLLNETDLLEIISRGLKARSLVAVAKRRRVTAPVVDALVDADQPEAIKAVLENKTAKIGKNAFDRIAEKAEMNKDWHNAMVYRDDLPIRTLRRIASFVNAALMEALISRNKGQKKLVEELRKTVRERIDSGDLAEEAEAEDEFEPAIDRVEKDFIAGNLDEEHLDKFIRQKDNAYIRYALCKLSGYKIDSVSKMLNTGNAKAIVALVWKTGMSPAFAENLQRQIGRVKNKQIISAGADGGFALSDDDMEWYLDSFFD